MPTLHIDVYEHAGFETVSKMRKMIADSVSQLKGESLVTYSLNYFPYEGQHIEIRNFTRRGEPVPVNVSTMRRSLAEHLSALPGDDLVSFSFHCTVAVG